MPVQPMLLVENRNGEASGLYADHPESSRQRTDRAADDLGLNYRTVQKGDFNNACTDVGDLSHLVPVVNFTFKGFEGKLHGADFKITDPEKAYIYRRSFWH